MTENKYKSTRIVDGKARKTIVDENGNIINRNPTKEELKGLSIFPEKYENTKCRISVSFDEKNFFWIVVDKGKFIRNPTKEDLMNAKFMSYNKTNTCDRCKGENERDGKELTDKNILYPKNAKREKDKNGKETGKWLCHKCKAKDYNNMSGSYKNIIKSMGNYRTGNLDPNSSNAKAINSQELACGLYGWVDLNKKYDNHKSPIDCYDPKTGLYHQVQERHYDHRERRWNFANFEREWKKIFEDMICFCISEDEKIVERIYKFPLIEIKRVTGIVIYKNPRDSWGNPKIARYGEYRITDENELKKANEIWTQILEKRKIF